MTKMKGKNMNPWRINVQKYYLFFFYYMLNFSFIQDT